MILRVFIFSYGDKFIKKFGYHRPSTQGGYIKKDGQYLKIGYISTEKGYVIVLRVKEKKIKELFNNKKYRKLSNDKFPVFCIFRFLYNNKKLILTHKFSTLLSKFCTQTTFFRFRWCNITKILDGCDINTTDNSFDLSLYRNVIEDCLITQ
mgnify:CR=1 FL=1